MRHQAKKNLEKKILEKKTSYSFLAALKYMLSKE